MKLAIDRRARDYGWEAITNEYMIDLKANDYCRKDSERGPLWWVSFDSVLGWKINGSDISSFMELIPPFWDNDIRKAMFEWCKAHDQDGYYHTEGSYLYVSSEEDALLVKICFT